MSKMMFAPQIFGGFIGAMLIVIASAGVSAAAPVPAAAAAAVTFSHDIAPIVYAHCAACHREGEAAPFALLTYKEVRKHARQIADITSQRIMPPWKAKHGFGDFLGERRLEDAQIAMLRQWVAQDCPEGDPSATPAPPRFTAGWQRGEPDLIVKMPQAFTVPPEGKDIYRCFAIPVKIPAGKYLTAVEFRPGNRKVVHHAVLSMLPSAIGRQKLASETDGLGPGFSSGLVSPGERLPGPMGFWVPGMDALSVPDGYALAWPRQCDLVVQLHLHPSGKPEIEQSSVGLYFTDQPPRGKIRSVVVMNKKVDIAAGDRDYKLSQSIILPFDADVIGVFPHMHLLGRSVTAIATLPDGTTRPLLSITDWDFNWQSYFLYASRLHLPKGTRVDCAWTYDNSSKNPANPSNPPRRVRFGIQTTDEMGVLVLDVIPTTRYSSAQAASVAAQRKSGLNQHSAVGPN